MNLTVEELARRLYEEFDKGAWGDVDPHLFGRVAEGETDDPDVDALREVIAHALWDDR